ncbi:unnamed protein product [Ectocarpus sp. 12 AP-2014]
MSLCLLYTNISPLPFSSRYEPFSSFHLVLCCTRPISPWNTYWQAYKYLGLAVVNLERKDIDECNFLLTVLSPPFSLAAILALSRQMDVSIRRERTSSSVVSYG